MRIGIYTVLVVCLMCSHASAEDDAIRITVTNEVARSAEEFEPLGVNYFGNAGGMQHSAGNVIWNAGFEPVTLREIHRVVYAGRDQGKYWVTIDGAGTSNWLRFGTGTFSGADMRAYRFADAQGKPVGYVDMKWVEGGKLLDASKAEQCIELFKTKVLPKGTPGFPKGGWLADTPTDDFGEWGKLSNEEKAKVTEGWRVYYEADVPLRMDDLVIFERTMIWPDAEDFHPRVRKNGVHSFWKDLQGASKQIAIPADAPVAMYGGKSVLEMTPQRGVAEIWNKLFCGSGLRDSFWYGTLDEGTKYRYEAWVKVADTPSGKLTFGFGAGRADAIRNGYYGTKIEKTFTVDGTWRRVGFEFVAPATPANGGIAGAILRYEGQGKLLMDNVKLQPVYKPGDEDKTFVIYPRTFDELMRDQPAAGRKGALRGWIGLTDGRMEAMCDWQADNALYYQGVLELQQHSLMTLPRMLTFLEATGDSPQTRMVPWIITQITHSEDEYRELVEYLAAPYDPAKDTPKSKPMAYMRTLQRGNNRPWTDDFRQVIIEFGNENWHNRAHVKWLGVGRAGMVHAAGREYGLWAKYMIGQMQASPYWDGKKLNICLGGNYDASVNSDGTVRGYGQEATIAAGGMNDYVSHATYIGPQWETGQSSQTQIDDAGIQQALYGYRMAKESEWSKQQQAMQRMHEMGYTKVKLSAYEGGPGWTRPKTREEEEAGKYYSSSNAMATALLDAWPDAWMKGWTHQCYLPYSQAASHSSISNGFRPFSPFMVQGMINHTLANHDLLNVRVDAAPSVTVNIPQSDWERQQKRPAKQTTFATLVAHAAGGGGYYAVSVSNLDLQQARQIEIRLPLQSAKRITRHYLTGGPGATNLKEQQVAAETNPIDPAQLRSGVFSTDLQPGAGEIYVFEK